MKDAEFQVHGLSEPRLAAHATSPWPAWLWSADGRQVLWANPAGAGVFGATDAAGLAARNFGPADPPHRRQVARLASRLPASGAIRMERLPGFGAAPGMLATCGCSRLDFPDGSHGVLVVAAEFAGRIVARARPAKKIAPASSDAEPSPATPPVVTVPPRGREPGPTGEAPAGFALFDAFAEEDAEPATEPLASGGPASDAEALARLTAQRRLEISAESSMPQPLSADIVQAGPAGDSPEPDLPAGPCVESSASPELPEPAPPKNSPQTDLDTPVEPPKETSAETSAETSQEPPKNVLPFRPIGEAKPPTLTPVENSAFNELARQLSARLDNDNGGAATTTPEVTETAVEPAASAVTFEPAGDTPEWLAPPEPPARGVAKRDKTLLDLLPVGILIYRLDRLLYANPAFLRRIGYDSLYALEEAGGLDALYVEPGVSTASSTSEAGKPVTISASHVAAEDEPPAATDARLYTISWDEDSALALICSGAAAESAAVAAAIAEASPANVPSSIGHAEELATILDTTAEGILMFDAEGNINSCNRSAEALFGYDGTALVQRNLADLLAAESQHGVFEYFASIKSSGVSSLLDHGRDALGRGRNGGIIPLSITMGRTRPDGPNFFAAFRDLSQSKKSESELLQARRLTDRAANAKADMLARISHEVRAPLNAIIGFAEVMIGERFGALGNERYAEYMKDIRASGEQVISIISDLLDLSRIETGKLDLAFANQNLNEMVESCVAAMQPQANRERIIIRTSLANTLPPVVADARALRQIALNLIGSSIHLAKAGGQVIVSTALSDFGEVMLRVRDTGQALNDNEVAAALEPFRTHGLSDQASDGAGLSLSLTKALVEANRAQFHIKPGPHSGTLIEVVFARAVARA